MKIRKTLFRLLLVFVLFVGLTMAFGGDIVFPIALRKYGPTAVGQSLTFEEAQLSLLRGRAEIDELTIGPTGDPLLRTGQILFDGGARDLLSGRLLIEEAVLDRARLRLVIDEDGRFHFDPGPPPPQTPVERTLPEPEPDAAEPTPAPERDLAQIVAEYWERYLEYKGYYDEHGGLLWGLYDDAVADGEDLPPGVDESLESAIFWLAHAEIAEFSWETLDRRSGKPILPEIERGTLRLSNIGQAAAAIAAELPADPAELRAELWLKSGGRFLFDLAIPHDAAPCTLAVRFEGLPIEALTGALDRSLPFQLKGGQFDLATEELRFSGTELAGRVRLELRGVELRPRKKKQRVLGLDADDFCLAINRVLTSEPVAFELALGGRPSSPTFEVREAPRLEKLLADALEAELRARADAELEKLENMKDEALETLENEKAKLEKKADKALEKLDGQIGDLEQKGREQLGEKVDEALGKKGQEAVEGLLGGGKAGGEKKKVEELEKKADEAIGEGLEELLGDDKGGLGGLFGSKKKKKKKDD